MDLTVVAVVIGCIFLGYIMGFAAAANKDSK